MNILLATDFSPRAKRASEAAAHLAARLNGQLLLVYPVSRWAQRLSSDDMHQQAHTSLDRYMRAEADRLQETGAVVEGYFGIGQGPSELISAARRFDTELLAVHSNRPGIISSGHTVLRKLINGSPVPVLALRHPEAFTGWAAGERPLRVVVGYDFSRSAEAALEWVHDFSEAEDLEITVAYISWPPEEAARYGIKHTDAFYDNSLEVERLLARDLEKQLAKHGVEPARIRMAGTWGRKDLQLLALAAVEDADLIVTGTNQRGLLGRLWNGSVSQGILREAPTNVVCVPASYSRKPEEEFVRAGDGDERMQEKHLPETALSGTATITLSALAERKRRWRKHEGHKSPEAQHESVWN